MSIAINIASLSITSLIFLATLIVVIKLVVRNENNIQKDKYIAPNFKTIHNHLNRIDADLELNTSQHKGLIAKLKEHDIVFAKYSNKDAFFAEISIINQTLQENKSENVCKFLNYQLKTITDFMTYLLASNINDLDINIIIKQATNIRNQAKGRLTRIFNKEFSSKYFTESGYLTDTFMERINIVLQDTNNDKIKRLYLTALDFSYNLFGSFVKFYNSNKNLIK